MSLWGYYIAFGLILLFALVATIMIGFSKQNREGNPEYMNRTAGNWTRLSLFYVLATLIGIVVIIRLVV